MAIKFPKNMFHSARLQLTVFYLVIILVFSVLVSTATRFIAERAYENADAVQRGQFRRLFLYTSPFDQTFPFPDPSRNIQSIQDKQEALVSSHLTNDLILINIGSLALGGLLSYWFAGRTLRPIEEAHENQKRFAADASHELRTPLTSLRTENEVFLRQKSFTPEEARELIKSNLEEVQRLENLSGNLLALTQYEHLKLDVHPVDVASMIEGAQAVAKKTAQTKAVTFEVKYDPAKVLGDEDSLIQLLTIILDNAVKYGPEAGTVFIKGRKTNGGYLLHVRDQGGGINETDLPHIFERLYRGDKARSLKDGYGLGLSLAQEIASALGATITARNHPGGGAEFTVVLGLA